LSQLSYENDNITSCLLFAHHKIYSFAIFFQTP